MLTLAPYHLEAMQTHAEQAYPQECCGLLLGKADLIQGQYQQELYQVRPMENTWDQCKSEVAPDQADLTTSRRYWVSPTEMIAAQKYARNQGWDIIGVYHSHPDQKAVPSECDRQWAWPQYAYVIVAVEQGIAQDLQSWMLDDDHRFQSQDVIVCAHA